MPSLWMLFASFMFAAMGAGGVVIIDMHIRSMDDHDVAALCHDASSAFDHERLAHPLHKRFWQSIGLFEQLLHIRPGDRIDR